MVFKKLLISGVLCLGIAVGTTTFTFAQDLSYKVQSGDTFWKISQKFGISTSVLMNANNANSSTVLYPGQIITVPQGNQAVYIVAAGDSYWSISKKYSVDFQKLLSLNNATVNSVLNIGDKVIIPSSSPNLYTKTYTVQKGDTYWIISQKFNVSLNELIKLNNATNNSYLSIGQVIQIPSGTTAPITPSQPASNTPGVTYSSYTVQKGDYAWSIAQKFSIPVEELMSVNNINSSTVLYIGMQLKIPVHNIPVKSTPGEQYGELLDWWTEVQYFIPIGSNFEVVDFYTGKSFFVRRTIGSSHADCETLSLQDTNVMKEIWGGNFSWVRRPVVIKFNGRKVAASMSAMPHAGNDQAPGGEWTSWRSGDYGAGSNFDYIKGNGIDGHFDIHFLNSTRHKDGALDTDHQANIHIAAGL